MKKITFSLVLVFLLLNTTIAQLSKDYQQAVSEYISKGDYVSAEKEMRSWIEEAGPDYKNLYLLYTNLGTMQRRAGNKEAAMESYNTANKLNPTSPSVLSNRASLKRQMDDLEGSLADYNLALGFGEDEGLLMNRAHTYNLLGDTLAATADLEKVLEINPENYRAMTNLMNLKVAKGAYTEALEFYTSAIEDHPGEPILFNNKADVLLKMKEYEKAMIEVNKAIKMEKSYDNAYVTRAEIYIATGDRKKALKDLQKAVKLGNDSEYVIGLIDECNRFN